MYLAELSGKLSISEKNKEDILTSNVFSFFKYAPREVFLSAFVQSLGLEINDREIKEAIFQFWPQFDDGTEPDLIILMGNFYILIEAKFHSGFGEGTSISDFQLFREFNNGMINAKSLGMQFVFIAITAHYSKNKFYSDISYFPNDQLIWTNWHQISIIIWEILQRNKTIKIETRSFAEDLYQLLVVKKLRNYAGSEIIRRFPLISEPINFLFFDPSTAQYRGNFIGFTHALQIFEILIPPKNIFFKTEKTFFTINSHEIGKLDSGNLFLRGKDG